MIIHFDNTIKKGEQVPADSFKYKLASIIAPRSKWQKDDAAKTCAHCDKAFIYLIRRKHHCRKCGQVFCNE